MEIREYRTYNEAEILRLYASVGWTAYTDHPEVLRKGFENSMLTLAAYEGKNLLGIIRTVGDGHTIMFVQDILVFPEYQRKGVGTALLQAILDRYCHVRQIELATDNTAETIAFYKSMGFREDKYFHPDAWVNRHNTNDHFTVEEFIRANCDTPANGLAR